MANEQRNLEILTAARSGSDACELANKYGLTPGTIEQIIYKTAEPGGGYVPASVHRKERLRLGNRLNRMIAARHMGKTYREIADEFGISAGRAQQILKKANG